MTMFATAADSPAGIDLAVGEYWIEFVPAARPAPRRHRSLRVRPRLRREVAEAVCQWLNLVYPTAPDWYPLARESDLLVVFAAEWLEA